MLVNRHREYTAVTLLLVMIIDVFLQCGTLSAYIRAFQTENCKGYDESHIVHFLELQLLDEAVHDADFLISFFSFFLSLFSNFRELKLQAHQLVLVPFATLSLRAIQESFKGLTARKIKRRWKDFQDSIYYGEILPPVASQQLSYAKFLQLLSHRKIKRIILLDNGTCAIVEVRK